MTGRQACATDATLRMAPPDRSGTFGLPRGRRLTPAGYRAVFDNQQSRATRYFVMWTRQTEETRGQLGVVAAKRSFRRAVDRNRARRLLREAYRLNHPSLLPDVDLILLARHPILGVKMAEVSRAFVTCCRQARIWKQEQP